MASSAAPPSAGDFGGGVLAADGAAGDFFLGERLDGAEDFDFFIADGRGVEGDGGLHGGEGEELHEVVLDHVAHDAGGFVVGSAAFDADGFGDGDLDGIHIVAVPDGFEDSVGEAEDEHVLDGLFSEVVVDAVDLRFVEDAGDVFIEFAGGGEVSAEGLFNDDAAPGVGAEGVDVCPGPLRQGGR